ncbi:MAG: YihY/virulence factor BrkB family protein [Pararhodobacter sp.]|nr:YihY/virulence factor BrkB family protein [Pararhodobacter sp.]
MQPLLSHAVAVWNLAGERHLGLIAAGVAFFAMLAIFPAIAALIALAGLWLSPELVPELMETTSELLPDEAYDLVFQQAERLAGAATGTLGLTSVLSLVMALWWARLGTGALADGLTAIYGGKPRGGVQGTFVALWLTLLMIAVGLIAIVAMLVVPAVMAGVGWFIGHDGTLYLVAEALRWGVSLGALVAGLGLFYRYGPHRPAIRRSHFLSPGLFLAIALWSAASLGFTLYMANFGNYDEIYGSIGAGIVLMLWFYFSAYSVLIGGALNFYLEQGRSRG